MKRFTQLALAGAIVLAVVAVAAAQQVPQPVVRIGDWVEVGNEVFMNIIATTDIRYRTTHNYDFEDNIRDRVPDRDNLQTLTMDQEFDGVYEESRIGVDMRFQKSLTMQVLLEHQSVMDGNLIDNLRTSGGTSTAATGGGLKPQEENTVNLERFWLQYAFPGTPLRLLVGADLWASDQAGVISDDDPRFAIYLDLGPKQEFELGAWAVIQTEASRRGLQNDNDFVYYVFHALYKGVPQARLGLDVAYFRDRSQSSAPIGGPANARLGEKLDAVLFMPSWSGTLGPFRSLVQLNLVWGTADSTTATGSQEYDIFAWGAIAYFEANLWGVTPFFGIVYGTGDDSPFDTDLEGFAPFPQREITITASGLMAHFDRAIAWGSRDLANPARSANAVLGGTEYGHTVGNPWNDRLANTSHTGINTTYANPGTLLPYVGVKVAPLQGHEIVGAYFYRTIMDASAFNAAFGRNIDKTQYHELMGQWTWTLNRHFDIRLTGNLVLPGAGSKDIAETVDCDPVTAGIQPCEGKDVALAGEARFRARF